MKKKILRSISAVLLGAFILGFAGCAQPTPEEFDIQFKTAIENSFNAPFFYWKETYVNGKNSKYTSCNVLTALDNKYEPILDENGDYAEVSINIMKTENEKSVYQLYCGKSASSQGGEAKEMLFTKDINPETEKSVNKVTPMTVEEYLNHKDFEPYTLEAKLKEVSSLTTADMDLTADKCGIEKKGNVTKINFTLTDEYFERYEKENGEPSMFEGSKRVEIEMAFERISHIIVYSEEPIAGSNMTIETEPYKLFIVYLGPKFSIPSYDEKDADGNPVYEFVG